MRETSHSLAAPIVSRSAHCSEWMTVREMLAQLQRLLRDAELLAFEAGCEDYYERELDDYLAF
jgi:hypothetical protein